nr:hypothetical protein [Saccharopolyspora subtropica]
MRVAVRVLVDRHRVPGVVHEGAQFHILPERDALLHRGRLETDIVSFAGEVLLRPGAESSRRARILRWRGLRGRAEQHRSDGEKRRGGSAEYRAAPHSRPVGGVGDVVGGSARRHAKTLS